MKPQSAKTQFLKRLEAAGLALDTLTPATGVEAMLEFYADERAAGCDLESDGDMLLFQWGINDWGDGPAFEINITRQLIATDDEDDEPRQLSLTFRLPPTAAPKGLRSGNKWCESPDGLAEFRRFVTSSSALQASQQSTAEVELRYGRT